MSNSAIKNAFIAAGCTEIDHTMMDKPFASSRVAQSVAFTISANYGKAATRIERLANPPKGTTLESMTETKAELAECIKKLAWGLDNVGDFMRDINEAVLEWAGGGFQMSVKDTDVEAAAIALGLSLDEARTALTTARSNRTDYLAVKRSGKVDPIVSALQRLLSQCDKDKQTEPSSEIIEAACLRAFQNAITWGDMTEAMLAKADMVYHCGKAPTAPTRDEAQAAKAAASRSAMIQRQLDQAQRDAQAIASFEFEL